MIENIFSIPFYREKLNVDNKKINDFVTSLSITDSGVKKSNINGWQSKNIINFDEMSEFLECLDTHLMTFSALSFIPLERKVDRLWANINRYLNYNLNHIHPGSIITGVYYTKVPKNSGSIYFNNPVKNLCGLSGFSSGFPEFASLREFPPEEGDLLLFPGWLDHGVFPNMNSEEERISVSFNVI